MRICQTRMSQLTPKPRVKCSSIGFSGHAATRLRGVVAVVANAAVCVSEIVGATLAQPNLPAAQSPVTPPQARPMDVIPQPVPVPYGAIDWWPGNGDTRDVIGGNNGIPAGLTSYAPGKVGAAFQFFGTNGGIAISNVANFGPGADFSIEAWIYVETTNAYPILTIVDKRTFPFFLSGLQYGPVGYTLYLSNGRLGLGMGQGPMGANNFSDFVSLGPDLRDGQFHHVAAAVDRNSTAGGKLYVDGQPVLTFDPTSEAGDLSNSEAFWIGRPNNVTNASYFSGLIDELTIYNRALGSNEIWGIFVADSAGKSLPGSAINDGIPAVWRQQYFGPSYATDPRAAATADPDGDGANNYQEFLAGTDPLNAYSVPRQPISVSTYAGSLAGGQDGWATNATFYSPNCVALDRQGRVWVVEGYQTGWTTSGVGGHRLRIIDSAGMVSTVAGSALPGLLEGWGSSAQFNVPFQVVFDSFGNALVSDRLNHRIRKVDPNGLVSTWAGSWAGYQDGWGTGAMFHTPVGLALDTSDNLYVADFDNFCIRRVSSQGFVTTFAGSVRGSLDGPLSVATFDSPHSVAMARDGSLYVADYNNGKVRRISSTGMVSTFASSLPFVEEVITDNQGAVYACLPPNESGGPSLYKFNFDGTLAWKLQPRLGLQDGPIANAQATRFGLLAFRPDGKILFPDTDNQRIRLLRLGVPPLLTLSPNGGMFTNFITITLSTVASNVVVRYTLDGTTPDSNAFRYTGPFQLTASATIMARAFVNSYPISDTVAASFVSRQPPSQPPTILNQPQSQTVALGSPATFSVSAISPDFLWYQWYFNGAPLGSATNSTFTIRSVTSSDLGSYFVEVRNLASGVNSAPALLSSSNSQAAVVRQLPQGYVAGVPVTVTLQANPPASATVYAVQDQPPAGWAVGAMSNSGGFDAVNRLIKFGPFLDAQPRTLTYVVTPPQGQTAPGHFSGSISVDGSQSAIGGDQDLGFANLHPADTNPGDWRISIAEMTSYSAAWKRGDTWPQPPNPIPISYMTRAAFLWRGGESYRYDNSIAAAPLYWVNSTLYSTQGVLTVAGSTIHPLAKMAKASGASQATAALANQYQPGQPLVITIDVKPAPGVAAYAVEDQPPAGWVATPLSGDGIYDPLSQKMKWGPFFDDAERTFSYQVTPPATATGTAKFQGIASFDGENTTIGGQRETAWGGVELPKLTLRQNTLTASGFELSFAGNPGQYYRLEYSEDLVNWHPLDTISNSTENTFYPVPPVGNRAQSFYRLVPWE
jgi:hypothetical protein